MISANLSFHEASKGQPPQASKGDARCTVRNVTMNCRCWCGRGWNWTTVQSAAGSGWTAANWTSCWIAPAARRTGVTVAGTTGVPGQKTTTSRVAPAVMMTMTIADRAASGVSCLTSSRASAAFGTLAARSLQKSSLAGDRMALGGERCANAVKLARRNRTPHEWGLVRGGIWYNAICQNCPH